MRTTRILNLGMKIIPKIPPNTQRFRLLSIIARKSKILSVGWNQRKTHRLALGTRHNELHAELSAILATREDDLTGCDIYVIRRTNKGTGMARPCEHCLNIIKTYKIRNIYYTIATENFNVKEFGTISNEKVS